MKFDEYKNQDTKITLNNGFIFYGRICQIVSEDALIFQTGVAHHGRKHLEYQHASMINVNGNDIKDIKVYEPDIN